MSNDLISLKANRQYLQIEEEMQHYPLFLPVNGILNEALKVSLDVDLLSVESQTGAYRSRTEWRILLLRELRAHAAERPFLRLNCAWEMKVVSGALRAQLEDFLYRQDIKGEDFRSEIRLSRRWLNQMKFAG